jgi:hypothetical protein
VVLAPPTLELSFWIQLGRIKGPEPAGERFSGMELTEADRICLREARTRELLARVCKEGREDEDGLALKAHLDAMTARGLLQRTGQRGTKARMQGAQLLASYAATEVGLALLDALERAEAAEAALAAQRPTRRPKRRSDEPAGPFAPGGCIVER